MTALLEGMFGGVVFFTLVWIFSGIWKATKEIMKGK